MKNRNIVLTLLAVLVMLAVQMTDLFWTFPDGWDKLITGAACLLMLPAFRDPAVRTQYPRLSRWLALFMLVAGVGEIIWGLVILRGVL